MGDHFPSLNDFQIERELGQSEDSTFYYAVEKRSHRKVLLKLLNPIYNTEPGIVQLFIEEAKAIRNMNHPGVIQLFDFGQESGFFFTAYERPVVTLMDRLPQLTSSESIDLFQDIIKVLDFMHIQGYVHGHLTPGSILFREDGTLALMNLGTFILQSYQNSSFDDGKVSPAAYYKSPEQCRNQGLDSRSDHYSLGAIFFHMLTKKPPYQADNTVGVIVKHVEAPPPQLPPEYARYQPLLDKMMAKDPNNRTQSGKEILDWLGSGTRNVAGNEPLELDFSPDFEPKSRNGYSSETAASPYLSTSKQKTNPWKLILPAIALLILATYFLYLKNPDIETEQLQNPSSTKRTPSRKGQQPLSEVEKKSMTLKEKSIHEIETAIEEGELSLAEAKINAFAEDPQNSTEVKRLREMFANKNLENKKQQYSAQLTIAQAALNSDDLSSAETALSNARKIMVDPELIRLEFLLQQKTTAPKEEKVDLPSELVTDDAEDDRTYLRAKMSRTQQQINEYLLKFPKGRHRQDAEILLKSIDTHLATSSSEKLSPAIQKKVVKITMSPKPTTISEAKLVQTIKNADFFENKHNQLGSFDNPLKAIPLDGCTTYSDPGLHRMWLAGRYGQSLTHEEAKTWITQINQQNLCGFSDWRLPTLVESLSLLRPKQSGRPYYSISEFNPPEWIWTSDDQDQNYAWAIFFNKGIADSYRKTDRLDTIAVRTHEDG